jgi:hypothetical protein
VRIMWTGSDSHAGDVAPAMRAVKRVLEGNPNSKFILFGWVPPEVEMLPRHQVEIYGGLPKVSMYFEMLIDTPVHIGIAPLAPTAFNSSKSWVKALEYGAVGTLPVLQKSPPYQSLEEGKEHAVFVEKFTEESWFRTLDPLVKNPDLVYQKAVDFQKAILGHYLMSQNVHKWVDFYHRVMARKHATWFPKNAPVRVNPDGSTLRS